MKIVHRLMFLIAALVLTTSTVFAQKIEYVLPYPGILPDHPLYTLKLVRDRILDFLIVDPLRKAEFSVLQADKRLGMGVALVEKGNAALAEVTLSKGEKYLARAAGSLTSVASSGKEVPAYLLDRVIKAAVKHEEILMKLTTRFTGKELDGLKSSMELLKKTIEDIVKLKS